jgi:glyoxylate reductase
MDSKIFPKQSALIIVYNKDMKKIYITRKIAPLAEQMLRDKGWEVDSYQKDAIPSKKEIIRTLRKKDYDAVLTLLTDKIDSEVMNAAPSVRIFANYAIGYDNFDLEEGRKRGVAMTNTPGDTFSYTIAEHAVALMLGLTTRMVEADDYVRKGRYKGWQPMNFVGTDMKNKTIGLVGAGHIGRLTARILRNGFEAKIKYFDIQRCEMLENELSATRVETLEELMRDSDIISLHTPLLPSTKHLINSNTLSFMKSSAILINTSRGAVIDEQALVRALKEKKIRGAGLDVFEFEPKLTRGLAKLSNVILTPHIASARESARNEMARIAAENIIEVLEGRPPKNPCW